MTNFYGLAQAESIVILGPPKTGKSWFLGSICEVVAPERVKLLITKPRERQSYRYRQYGLDATGEIYFDAGWDPELNSYEAKNWKRLKADLYALRSNADVDAVLLDPGTDAITLYDHHLLSPQRLASPGDMSDTRGYYRQLKDGAQGLINSLQALTIPELTGGHPKFVIVAWHTQPPREDQQPTRQEKQAGVQQKPSADKRAEGVEHWGDQLPMIEGSYRRKLKSDFSIVVESCLRKPEFDAKTKKMSGAQYAIRVLGNADHQVAIAGLSAEDLPEYLPNEFSEIYERLVQQ